MADLYVNLGYRQMGMVLICMFKFSLFLNVTKPIDRQFIFVTVLAPQKENKDETRRKKEKKSILGC